MFSSYLMILSDRLEVSSIIKSRPWAFWTQIKSDALRGESLLTKEFNQGLGLMCFSQNCFRLSDGGKPEPRRDTDRLNPTYMWPHRGVISCNKLLDRRKHGWCQCIPLLSSPYWSEVVKPHKIAGPESSMEKSWHSCHADSLLFSVWPVISSWGAAVWVGCWWVLGYRATVVFPTLCAAPVEFPAHTFSSASLWFDWTSPDAANMKY